MTDFLRSLASSDGLMPHGMCYLWDPPLLWLHLVSDALTGLAYWAIPPALFVLVWKARKEIPSEGPYARGGGLPYEWMFVAFAVFIVACGTTHLLGVWTIWSPRYWLSGGAKAVTAVASVATAIALPPLVPRAIQLLRDARDSEARRQRLEVANRELEELSERLKEADRLKSQLVANVSHELRTPLALILGPAEDLLAKEEVSDDVRTGLEVMQRSARSLLGQVDDLLDAARLELDQATPTFEDLEVRGTVGEIVDQFRPLARSQDVELTLDAGEAVPVRLDPEMMERILLNLLSNAFKFTPGGGRIRVVLRTEPAGREGSPDDGSEGREELIVEVRDSGPGVPEEVRPVIFERFRQVDGGSTRRHGGAGLGLSIARQFAEAQGGTIEVGDAPEGGAAFTVRLPLRAVEGEVTDPGMEGSGRALLHRARLEARAGTPRTEPQEPAPDDAAGTGAQEGASVGERTDSPSAGDGGGAIRRDSLLLVEDDPALREFLVPVLEREYRVRAVDDGIEGLRAIDEARPDLILTDMMMPRMDGETFLGEVRKRPELARIPVIVLTAKADPELVARVLHMGAQDYLLKPVTVEELRARIENHLDLARTRNILQEELESREVRLRFLADDAARRKRRLETLLQEKSVLVQELHHRVKGNLQTITSLLNLQARRVSDPGARDVLYQSRGRIAAMSLLHERLYQSGDPTETEMLAYVERLVRDVFQSWGREVSGVRHELEVDPVTLGAERAVSCGLLLHELVTNALRHGYSSGDQGIVEVRLNTESQGDGEIHSEGLGTTMLHLVVQDDGTGFPPGFEPEASESLGLSLVSALVEQLGGEAEVESQPGSGVRWLIRFPTERPGLPTEGVRDDG